MTKYFTKGEARAAALQAKQRRNAYDSKRLLRESVYAATDHHRFDIFLSHSSSDSDLILGVKALLENAGYTVYVDWVDDAQLDRSHVTRETADLLRRRMKQSNSLVWVATEAAGDSKWMPWELGYFDGFKPGHVAILPLVNNQFDAFKGQEYLALYPVVGNDVYQSRLTTFVEDKGRLRSTFGEFASGRARWVSY